MPRVLFTADFDWSAKPRVTVFHKAGHKYLVTQACADEAIAAGKAVALPSPARAKPATRARRGAGDAGR